MSNVCFNSATYARTLFALDKNKIEHNFKSEVLAGEYCVVAPGTIVRMDAPASQAVNNRRLWQGPDGKLRYVYIEDELPFEVLVVLGLANIRSDVPSERSLREYYSCEAAGDGMCASKKEKKEREDRLSARQSSEELCKMKCSMRSGIGRDGYGAGMPPFCDCPPFGLSEQFSRGVDKMGHDHGLRF